MAQVSSLMLARFTRLPRRSADAWQGGIFRMPLWVDGPDGTPYRPWGGVWVSLETGLANVKLAEADTGDPRLAEAKAMLARMAANTNGPPHPAALEGRGVTVERMRAFAVAARDFYAAAPWRHLSDEDLIYVEA